MNDPTEGKLLGDLLFGQKSHSDGRKSVDVPYIFIKCFTRKVDYLPMWEMYGGHAEGVCVVIDWWNSETSDTPLYNVSYLKIIDDEIRVDRFDNPDIRNCDRIEKWLNRIRGVIISYVLDRKIVDELIGDAAYLFKDSSYSYETEQRILYSYKSANDAFLHTEEMVPKLFIQPDFTIQISELILGPKLKDIDNKVPYIEEEIELMCRRNGKYVPSITVSDIRYR